MHKFMKYFYENKSKILKVVFFVIFVFLIIQILNNIAKNEQNRLYEQAQNDIDSGKKNTIDNSNYLINQKQNVTKSENEKIKSVMEKFVQYCNEKNIQSAYDLITDECKNQLFDGIEDFKEKYIDIIYKNERNYSMQAWSKNNNMYTYLITYTENVLETGKKGNTSPEYCTFIKQENGDYKINVNNYIYGQEYKNLKTDNDDVNIEILEKNVYKDYVIYEFKISNETDKTICLNYNKSNSSVYLNDKDNITYSSVQSDFEKKEDILIEEGKNRKFRIKFNKVYNPNISVKSLNVGSIIMDYEEYKKMEEQEKSNIEFKNVQIKFSN